MAVVGLGTDVVDVERIDALLSHGALGQRFRDRVFTASERDHCERRRRSAESYAGRFAAKEAVIKALGGTGAWGFPWKEIEIVADADGAPSVKLHGRTACRARARQVERLHVSIAHGAEVAIAQAIAEGG
jgi:holo-[acyl-carrier protein] synthase